MGVWKEFPSLTYPHTHTPTHPHACTLPHPHTHTPTHPHIRNMFEITIALPDQPPSTGSLAPGMYRIGSSPASHIQINRPEVSHCHAVLQVKNDLVTLTDVGSTNGTFVNGKRLSADKEISLDPDTAIGIGAKVTLEIHRQGAEKASQDAGGAPGALETGTEGVQLLLLSGIRYEYRKVAQGIKRKVHEELLKRVNLKNLTLSGAGYEEIKSQARGTIQDILTELKPQMPRGVDVSALQEELVSEAVGLGPLEKLLADDTITEIMVNGANNVYVEKAGMLYKTDLTFAEDAQVQTVIERIVAPLGRRIDESQPLVDARLADGSRVNAIIPPLAIDGPSLTIRKFAKQGFVIDDLIKFGTLNRDMADFLNLCVKLRKNILISGGTGSGKTTLLNVVSNFLPNRERIVTIEDAAELRLSQEHVVRLEARPPNIEGRGAIAIRDLVRNALRMRPDRIVIGECRGGEALDMLQAMNTGHDGSMTTLHANGTRDALARLETLVLMAGFELPLRAIREQVAAAISIVVHTGRLKDGTRKVLEISEITGMEGEVITSQELFQFKQEKLGKDGKVIGHYRPCNIVPTFIEEIQVSGLAFDIGIFTRDSN